MFQFMALTYSQYLSKRKKRFIQMFFLITYLHVEIFKCYGVFFEQIIGIQRNKHHSKKTTEMSSTWSGSNLIGGKQRSHRGTRLSNSLKSHKCPYRNSKIQLVLHELYMCNNIYTIFKVYLYLYASLHNGLQKIYIAYIYLCHCERCDMLRECGKNQHFINVSIHVASPYFFFGNTLPN